MSVTAGGCDADCDNVSRWDGRNEFQCRLGLAHHSLPRQGLTKLAGWRKPPDSVSDEFERPGRGAGTTAMPSTFQEEYIKLLQRCGVEFDECYLW